MKNSNYVFIIMFMVLLVSCSQLIEESFERNFDLAEATVVINNGEENQGNGVVITCRSLPNYGFQIVLIAPTPVFEDENSKFSITFTNLSEEDPLIRRVRKHMRIGITNYELRHDEKYSLTAISLLGASTTQKFNHPNNSNLKYIEFYDIVKTKRVQQDLMEVLGIQHDNQEDAIKHIQNLIIDAAGGDNYRRRMPDYFDE